MSRIPKSRLVDLVLEDVSVEYEFHRRHIEVVVDSLIKITAQRLDDGETIMFSGFGSLVPRQRKPRQARNPLTGDVVPVPASRTVTFKPAKQFRLRLNRDR